MLAAYDLHLRQPPASPPAGTRYETDGPLTRVVNDRQGLLRAPRDVGVDGADLDRLIRRQQDYFAGLGLPAHWKVRGHDRPADLTDRLRAAGFRAEETSTVVVAEAAAQASEPVLPDGVTIREVTADDDLRRIGEHQTRVYGRDCAWLAEDLIGRLAADRDQLAIFVAEAGRPGGEVAEAGRPGGEATEAGRAGGEVVGSAWLGFMAGTEFAVMLGGATLREWRGRGIYRALIAVRARRAAGRGFRYLQVDASSASQPILTRLGFTAITTTTPYVWNP